MWRHINIGNAVFGGPREAPDASSIQRPIDAFASEEYSSEYIVYRASDSHIHLLQTNEDKDSWMHVDVHDDLFNGEIPALHIGPCGFAFEENETINIAYFGSDLHLHLLSFNGRWHHTDLTEDRFDGDLPICVGEIAGFGFEDGETINIVYQADDFDLHLVQFSENDGRWRHRNLNSEAFGNSLPRPAGGLCGFGDEDREELVIAYLDDSGQVHRISHDGRWRHQVMNESALRFRPTPPKPPRRGFRGALGGYALDDDEHQNLVYRGIDDHLHMWRLDDGRWDRFDFDVQALAPGMNPVKNSISCYSNEDAETQNIVYKGMDDNIHLLWADDNDPSFFEALGNVFVAIGKVVGGAVAAIGEFFADIIEIMGIGIAAFFEAIGLSFVARIFESVFDLIATVYNAFVGAIAGIIKGVFGLIGGLFRADLDLFVDSILVDILGSIFSAIIALFGKFLVFYQSFIGPIWDEGYKRSLTDAEIAFLRPIFGNSISYFNVRIVDGSGGAHSANNNPFVLANTIYMKAGPARVVGSPRYNETLVHECVHIWQYQIHGINYIGDALFSRSDLNDAENWESIYPPHVPWTDFNPESQAAFIDELFRGVPNRRARGELVDSNGTVTDDTPGAFFRENRQTTFGLFLGLTTGDNTDRARAALEVIRGAQSFRLSSLFR